MSEPKRIDWSKLFDDLVYLGVTGSELATRLGVDMHYLRRLASGQRPSAAVGERALALWCGLTTKAPAFAPQALGPVKLMGEPVLGLADDDIGEPPLFRLEQIAHEWARKTASR